MSKIFVQYEEGEKWPGTYKAPGSGKCFGAELVGNDRRIGSKGQAVAAANDGGRQTDQMRTVIVNDGNELAKSQQEGGEGNNPQPRNMELFMDKVAEEPRDETSRERGNGD